jgi:hypothetical protein
MTTFLLTGFGFGVGVDGRPQLVAGESPEIGAANGRADSLRRRGGELVASAAPARKPTCECGSTDHQLCGRISPGEELILLLHLPIQPTQQKERT